ncbi:hypothetical protein [Streptomyces sp. NPDC054865]
MTESAMGEGPFESADGVRLDKSDSTRMGDSYSGSNEQRQEQAGGFSPPEDQVSGGAGAGLEGSEGGDELVSSVGAEASGITPSSAAAEGDDDTDPGVRAAQRWLSAAVADLRQEALFNFGEMTAVKLTAVLGQLLEHSELPDGYLETVLAVFAEPDGFHEACEALERPGAVLVLPRESGAGRTFTAHALLAELRRRTGARVGPLSFGATPRFPLRLLPRDENVGYLLELPADEEGAVAVSADFGAMISQIEKALVNRSSRLIVLTTPEQWQRIRGGAPQGVVPELGAPDPLRVARSWLRAEAPNLDSVRWLNDERIQGLLKGQSPSDVLQIVDLILKADRFKPVTTEADPDGFNARVVNVEQARTNWRDELLQWHKKPGRADFERNFLLVASLLRNATVAQVYVQTAELCTRFKRPVSLEGQAVQGVIELVAEIEAELDPIHDTIDFSRPGWGDAVLNYFWIDRPVARNAFLEWMAEAPTPKQNRFLETFTKEERLLLANRVGAFAVRWATRHRKADPLEKIISAWRRDDDLWKAAIDLVSAAALHPGMGRFVHEQLLKWSKSKEDAALRKLAVDVCAGDFGRLYTGKALLRLGYAAGSDDPGVQKALWAAVRTIWSDPTVRQPLFAAITSWCEPGSGRIDSGRRSFAALATMTGDLGNSEGAVPVLLPSASQGDEFAPAAESLSAGWSVLLSAPENHTEPAEALGLWMDAAHCNPYLRPLVFRVLRGGTERNGSGPRAQASQPAA